MIYLIPCLTCATLYVIYECITNLPKREVVEFSVRDLVPYVNSCDVYAFLGTAWRYCEKGVDILLEDEEGNTYFFEGTLTIADERTESKPYCVAVRCINKIGQDKVTLYLPACRGFKVTEDAVICYKENKKNE